MNRKKIEEIILIYFPAPEFDDRARENARLLGENIERETRHDATALAYDLANKLANRNKE